jgi:hypothetical protein
MTLVIIILGVILILFNLTLGITQLNLYQRGIYNSDKRFSYKRLNQCIVNISDDNVKILLLKIKKLFVLYLILFYLEVSLILNQLIHNYVWK